MIRYLAPLIFIAGCTSQSAYEQDFAYCSSNGTNSNIDQVNACLNYQSTSRQIQSDKASAGMLTASAILLANRPAPVVFQPVRQPMNCTSTYNSFLNQMQTRCW